MAQRVAIFLPQGATLPFAPSPLVDYDEPRNNEHRLHKLLTDHGYTSRRAA